MPAPEPLAWEACETVGCERPAAATVTWEPPLGDPAQGRYCSACVGNCKGGAVEWDQPPPDNVRELRA